MTKTRAALQAVPERERESGPSVGTPLEIDVTMIVEDPNQPRTANNPGFSTESLAELAQSISDRGIKTPISVRRHPEQPGHYLVNHGARRLRAAKLANRSTVPAFIDEDYNDFDKIVENLQRNELTPREIAEFISREVNKGCKRGDVAKRIGKSNAFVTQHMALLDLPEPIAIAFNEGRVQDVTAINELVKLSQTHAAEVEQYLSNPESEVTRKTVKQLRDAVRGDGELGERTDAGEGAPQALSEGAPKESKKTMPDSGKLRKAIVLLTHRGKEARLLYDRRPEKRTRAWIRYEKGGTEASVELSQLKLAGLLEG